MKDDKNNTGNLNYIVIDANTSSDSYTEKQFYNIIANNNHLTFNNLNDAYDALTDYVIEHNMEVVMKGMKIMKLEEINNELSTNMLLSKVIEWVEELREDVQGKLKYLEKPFLCFDTGTPISVVILWIRDKTGYDLSWYFKELLK